MTDIMSEAYGRELVARTTFEKEAVWLPLLALHQFNAGQPIIADKTFVECVLEGPAVIAPLGGTTEERRAETPGDQWQAGGESILTVGHPVKAGQKDQTFQQLINTVRFCLHSILSLLE